MIKYIHSLDQKEGKFYLAGFVGPSSTFVTFCDTGADLSLAPLTWRNKGNVKSLDRDIVIKSFDGKSEQILTESVVLRIHFGNCILHLKFYLCDVTTPIIGTDLLRNPRLKMSLNTKTENFHIDKQIIHTSANEHGAIDELHKRMKARKEQVKSINEIRRINWARATVTRAIQSGRTVNVNVTCDQALSPNNKYVFISLHDTDEKELYIPSLLVENISKTFNVTIENKSTEEKYIDRHQPLGEMKLCSHLTFPNRKSVVTYSAEDIREAMRHDDEDDDDDDDNDDHRRMTGTSINVVTATSQSGSAADNLKEEKDETYLSLEL